MENLTSDNYITLLAVVAPAFLFLISIIVSTVLYKKQSRQNDRLAKENLELKKRQLHLAEKRIFIQGNSELWEKKKYFPNTQQTEQAEIIPSPEVEYIKGTLSELSIKGAGPASEIKIELAQRANLFTGDNGLGKSFILEIAWWALSGSWAGFSVYPDSKDKKSPAEITFEIKKESGAVHKTESIYDFQKQEWLILNNKPLISGIVVYARADGSFAIWDPLRNYKPDKSQNPLVFGKNEIWNGLQYDSDGKTSFISNGLIKDWIDWQNSPDQSVFTILKNVLKRLSPPNVKQDDIGIIEPGKPVRIPEDSRKIPTIKQPYGEIPLLYASSGLQRIISLAYLIVWTWEEHKNKADLTLRESASKMIILIDEIEAHLHPKWQRKIISSLFGLKQDLYLKNSELNMQFLITTHSPLITASLEPEFDADKDKAFHLSLENNNDVRTAITREIEFVNYGTVNSWLASDFFDSSQPRSIQAEKAIARANGILSGKNVSKDQIRKVSDDLLRYIAPHDTFWVRWTFFAEQKGVEL
jgi:predicted ATPase